MRVLNKDTVLKILIREEKAQHPAEFKPTITLLRGVCSTAVLQPLPQEMKVRPIRSFIILNFFPVSLASYFLTLSLLISLPISLSLPLSFFSLSLFLCPNFFLARTYYENPLNCCNFTILVVNIKNQV